MVDGVCLSDEGLLLFPRSTTMNGGGLIDGIHQLASTANDYISRFLPGIIEILLTAYTEIGRKVQ